MSETKNIVTNEDVLRFYKEAPTDEKSCPVTAAYLKQLKNDGENLHGPYWHVINTFKGKTPNCNSDDYKFYKRLDDLKSSGELFKLNALKDLDPHFDVFLNHTDPYHVCAQKWHLYVSWYAYRESGLLSRRPFQESELCVDAKEEPNGIFKKRYPITCPELLIWMYEAAVNGMEKSGNVMKDSEAQEKMEKLQEELEELQEEIDNNKINNSETPINVWERLTKLTPEQEKKGIDRAQNIKDKIYWILENRNWAGDDQ